MTKFIVENVPHFCTPPCATCPRVPPSQLALQMSERIGWFLHAYFNKALLFCWEGVMDMAIQIMIFEGFPLLLGKGSGGGHCHTKTSSEKLSSLFWEREGVVARYGHGVG